MTEGHVTMGEGSAMEQPQRVLLLLAHEEMLFRELIRGVLNREQDLEVSAEAADVQEAIRKATTLLPDVVLVSARLPGGGGLRAMAAIKKLLPECRVILASDDEDQSVLLAALEAGAAGYVTKRSSARDVVDAVRASAAGAIPVPNDMQTGLILHLLDRMKERDEAMEQLTMLTMRERDVLALLVEGLGTEAIAEHLVISPETARTHVQNLLEKLGVHSRLEAVALVRKDVALERLLMGRESYGPRRPATPRRTVGGR
jgi:DNA-binding NarL/FixJ family response regulator